MWEFARSINPKLAGGFVIFHWRPLSIFRESSEDECPFSVIVLRTVLSLLTEYISSNCYLKRSLSLCG